MVILGDSSNHNPCPRLYPRFRSLFFGTVYVPLEELCGVLQTLSHLEGEIHLVEAGVVLELWPAGHRAGKHKTLVCLSG